MKEITVYTVRRDSADGPEVDCFLSEDNAREWAAWCGSDMVAEHTLDAMLPDLKASCENAEEE